MPVWRNARLRRLYGKPEDPIEAPSPVGGFGSRSRNIKKDEPSAAQKPVEATPPPPPPPKRVKREKTRPESEYELVHGMPVTQTAPDYSLLTKPMPEKEANVIAYAIHTSRQNWLNGSMLETFWTRKPRGKKLADGQVNLREKMTKLHECTITLGPHTFPVRLFTVRDDNVHVDEEADSKIEERLKKEKQEAAQDPSQEPSQGSSQEPKPDSSQDPSQGPSQGSSQGPSQETSQEPRDAAAAKNAAGQPERLEVKPDLDAKVGEPAENASRPHPSTDEGSAAKKSGPGDSLQSAASDNAQVSKDGPSESKEAPEEQPSGPQRLPKNVPVKAQDSQNTADKGEKSSSTAVPGNPAANVSATAEGPTASEEDRARAASTPAAPASSEALMSQTTVPSEGAGSEPRVDSSSSELKAPTDAGAVDPQPAKPAKRKAPKSRAKPSQGSLQQKFQDEKDRLEAEKRRNQELELKLKDSSTQLAPASESKEASVSVGQGAQAAPPSVAESHSTTQQSQTQQSQTQQSQAEQGGVSTNAPSQAESSAEHSNSKPPNNQLAQVTPDRSTTSANPPQPLPAAPDQDPAAAPSTQPGEPARPAQPLAQPAPPPPHAEMPRTAPNQLVVYRLQQMAARDPALSELMKHVASGTAPPDSIAKFQEVINRVKASIFTAPPVVAAQPKRQPAQARAHPAAHPKPQVHRPAVPYQPRANAKAIMLAIEFDECPSDRFLLPKRSILEYVAEKEDLLWSFLHVSEPRDQNEPRRYTPFTAVFHKIPLRVAQTLERCVRKPEVVAVYMKEAMAGAERSEPWNIWFQIERNDEVLMDLMKKTSAPYLAPPPPPRKPTKPRKPRGPTPAQLRAMEERERLMKLHILKQSQPRPVAPYFQTARGQPFIQPPSHFLLSHARDQPGLTRATPASVPSSLDRPLAAQDPTASEAQAESPSLDTNNSNLPKVKIEPQDSSAQTPASEQATAESAHDSDHEMTGMEAESSAAPTTELNNCLAPSET